MKTRLIQMGTAVLLAIFLLWGAAALLVSNSLSTTVQAAPAEPIAITIWHNHTGSREAQFQQFLDEFNANNTENISITGEYIGSYNDLHDQVINAVQNGGELPNIVIGYPNDFADYARYGIVHFMDQYLDDPDIGLTDPNDVYDAVRNYYRLGEYGNQLAGLQNGRSIEVLYYNQTMLTNAGLTVPNTWEEFATANISVTTPTVTGTLISTGASNYVTWLWSRDGQILSDDFKNAVFHEQPGIDSLLFFQDLINQGVAVPYTGYANTSFGEGQTAFFFGSSSGIPYTHDSMNNGVQHDWGVTHVPAIPGHEVVDSYGGGMGILHGNEAANRAAWIFIEWMLQQEQTARWAAMTGYFPVRASAETHPDIIDKLANDPQYAQAHALLPLGYTEPAIRGYSTIRDILTVAVEDTLANGSNVTDTLQMAAEDANDILATYGANSASIPPEGGMLTYSNTQGALTTVEFPPDSLSMTETVSYVPLTDMPTNGLAFALLPDLTFSQPVTITIHYQDSDVVGMNENELKLFNFNWSLNSWVDADPCGGYQIDTVNNILQARVCHFSDYTLAEYHFVYLPLIIK